MKYTPEFKGLGVWRYASGKEEVGAFIDTPQPELGRPQPRSLTFVTEANLLHGIQNGGFDTQFHRNVLSMLHDAVSKNMDLGKPVSDLNSFVPNAHLFLAAPQASAAVNNQTTKIAAKPLAPGK